MNATRKGFSLIEILIVVAIVAVLASIVVPNFEEAKSRRKVSRIKSDLRTLAVGLSAYYHDYNHYPAMVTYPGGYYPGTNGSLYVLTTPVAYLATINMVDPFHPLQSNGTPLAQPLKNYTYVNYEPTPPELLSSRKAKNWMDAVGQPKYASTACLLESYGPNRLPDNLEWLYLSAKMTNSLPDNQNGLGMIYDPTNGTISGGDIGRLVGDPAGLGESMH